MQPYHASRYRALDLLQPRICRHGDYRHMPHDRALCFQISDHTRAREAVHDGHLQIHQDDGKIHACIFLAGPESRRLKNLESFAAVVGKFSQKSNVSQLLFENALVHEIVFHD